MSARSNGVSRRELLRVGVLGGLGLSLADYLRLAEASDVKPKADACIFLHLAGGASHLDTLDMKPDAPLEEQGEFKRIASAMPGVPVCEHLPKLGAALDKFTMIRGITHAAGAHPLAIKYLYTGNRPTPAVDHPALGSVMTKERPVDPELPSFVAIPNAEMTAGYLGVAYAPFKTTTMPKAGKPFEVRGLTLPAGLTIDQVKNRNALLADLDQKFREADANSPLVEGLDRFAKQAQQMILSKRSREAFDTSRESPNIVKLFAEDDLGQSLLLAVRLVEQGVRFVTVISDKWDTHYDNFVNLKTKLLPPLDANLPALIAALEAKGLLDRTLVVATGEFGRTPTINKNAGRDHWPRTMWTLVAGGGTRRANLVGGTDAKGHGPDDRTNLKPDDLAASIFHALGVDHRKEYFTRSGRPVLLVPNGEVISDLFI